MVSIVRIRQSGGQRANAGDDGGQLLGRRLGLVELGNARDTHAVPRFVVDIEQIQKLVRDLELERGERHKLGEVSVGVFFDFQVESFGIIRPFRAAVKRIAVEADSNVCSSKRSNAAKIASCNCCSV